MYKILLKKSLPSFCTSNFDVLKVLMVFNKYHKLPTLIESTSNQVNQFGGYTGLEPKQFKKKIRALDCTRRTSPGLERLNLVNLVRQS